MSAQPSIRPAHLKTDMVGEVMCMYLCHYGKTSSDVTHKAESGAQLQHLDLFSQCLCPVIVCLAHFTFHKQ